MTPELIERLRSEAKFILGDAAAWGVDTYDDQPRTVKLLLEAADALEAPTPREAELEAALTWYAEQVGNCRKLHSEGDAARRALNDDRGERARLALNPTHGKEPKDE